MLDCLGIEQPTEVKGVTQIPVPGERHAKAHDGDGGGGGAAAGSVHDREHLGGTTTGSTDGTASASGSLSTPAGTPATAMSSSAGAATDPAMTESVMKVVNEMRESKHLRAVLVRVTVDGQVKVEQAVGESMTGVPATTDMHFRNGAVGEIADLKLAACRFGHDAKSAIAEHQPQRIGVISLGRRQAVDGGLTVT